MADSTDEQESHNSKNLEELKKAAKRSLPNDFLLDLPDPKFREALGDVQRRTNRTIAAEPPPPPTAQASSAPQHRRSNRKGKLNNGFDGEDGSGSDDDDPRRTHREGDAPVAKRRPTKQLPPDTVEHSEAGPSNSTPFTPEEQERISLQRTLRSESDVLHSALENFQRNNDRAAHVKKQMVEENDLSFEDAGMGGYLNRVVIKLQERRMCEFLDEALGRDTVAEDVAGRSILNENPDEERALIEEIIERVEFDFIIRWKWRVGGTFQQLAVQNLHVGSSPTVFLLVAIVDYMHATRFSPQGSFSYVSFQESLVDKYERAVLRQPDDGMRALLFNSRPNGQLSPKYIEFIYSFVSRSQIERAISERRSEKYFQAQGEKTREIFNSLGKQITQPFCHEAQNGGVVLVHYKGYQQTSRRHVFWLDLERFGWLKDFRCDGQYYRYHFDGVLNAIFKVTMDGKVLELVYREP